MGSELSILLFAFSIFLVSPEFPDLSVVSEVDLELKEVFSKSQAKSQVSLKSKEEGHGRTYPGGTGGQDYPAFLLPSQGMFFFFCGERGKISLAFY